MLESFFNSISKSMELLKKSVGVLMSEKKLILFPLISGIVLIMLLMVMLVPTIFVTAQGNTDDATFYGILFVYYLVSYFVIIFFNCALIHAVKNKIDNVPVSLPGSIIYTLGKIPNILLWAIISATVGLILGIIRGESNERGNIVGLIGSYVASLLGAAWSVVTFFVVPYMVFENVNPITAIGKSFELIKKTWGEQVIGGLGLGIAFFLIYLITVITGTGLVILEAFAGISGGIIIATIGVFVALFVLLFMVQGALQGIFVTELYAYATTGQSQLFNESDAQNAFKSKDQPKQGMF